MKYHAAIFDLDGTLLDTLADLADSMNHVLEWNGHEKHPLDAYKYFVGNGMEMLVRRAIPVELCDENRVRKYLSAFKAEYATRWDKETVPYHGIADMLDQLQDKCVRTAVLSNKAHDFTGLCVEKLLGDWSFDVVQGVSEAIPPKPDQKGVQSVIERLDVDPSRIIYLGDTSTDMQTAKGSNLFAVGCSWGFRPRRELLDAGADVVIDHPSELVKLID
ncbi:MAG: HAD family hydrolase [Phycisphaerae bacterium]